MMLETLQRTQYKIFKEFTPSRKERKKNEEKKKKKKKRWKSYRKANLTLNLKSVRS